MYAAERLKIERSVAYFYATLLPDLSTNEKEGGFGFRYAECVNF